MLGRYGSGADGLQLPPFVKARRTIVEWLATLPPPKAEELPAAARAAKAAFLPPTEANLTYAKTDLLAALRRLDARLKSSGDRGKDWAAYLKLDGVQGTTHPREARPQSPRSGLRPAERRVRRAQTGVVR